MRKWIGWIFGILAFLLPLSLYIKTLASTYIPVDSAEFTLCMKYWGICHPPGFPLYILVGKIFIDVFPFGSLIYKANLLSAIFGSATILVVYLTLTRLKVHQLMALLISLVLSVNATFWEYSVVADIFTFATLLIALTFFFLFHRRYYLAFFTLGLSVSHFYISAILFPVIAWYWYLKDKRVRGSEDKSYYNLTIWLFNNLRNIIILVSIFLLGFFPQIILYFRMQATPEINWGHAQGIGGFIDFIRRKEFGNIFLIANPVLKFSILNFFKHIYSYFANMFGSFGVILPILIPVSLVFTKFKISQKYILLFTSIVIIILIQLFLLSTIDPNNSDSPFQIHKFYLSSYIPLIILAGLAIGATIKKVFDGEILYPSLFLVFLIFIYLISNFRVNNYSNNFYSQDLVLDAMEQLPSGSVAITVSHVFNFGTRYEQMINHKFRDKTILYFPNEKNLDNEYYYPQFFGSKANSQFIDDVGKDKNLGKAESYILSIIGGNLDHDIYILQGSFEEKFFGYLKPYIRPYGLWWKVESDIEAQDELERGIKVLSGMRGEGIKFVEIHQKQQQLDSLTYAVSYHSLGIMLAKYGKYNEAVEFLKKSFKVREIGDNIQNEINLIDETGDLINQFSSLVNDKDEESLEKLGNNLFILMDYNKCTQVFQVLTDLNSKKAENYSNLASCQASMGDWGEAKVNYQKALDLNPKLEKAKKGLEELQK
ncbi:hypothetical protein A2164_02930 [Candidatus Curtissbacteria bacterium RBG_13_35_7]|uniref:Glycosyltransferase RgtA/B/C/D-like domain-containing protein n=1 Tax=Candidatus Curtissbacteria bacterium RBG_13_35_7 TaxID=1797705 RepID=A0A1F5G0A5_9BACT|nr:MAG: hypothetical protein A2164_02930 [Candidatus Curtissbacteria bacterium RBG_13_35_7]